MENALITLVNVIIILVLAVLAATTLKTNVTPADIAARAERHTLQINEATGLPVGQISLQDAADWLAGQR